MHRQQNSNVAFRYEKVPPSVKQTQGWAVKHPTRKKYGCSPLCKKLNTEVWVLKGQQFRRDHIIE